MITACEDIVPVVRVTQGRPTTTSLILAEKFGKRHDTVLRAIRNLEIPGDFNARNFVAVEVVRFRAIGLEIPCVRAPRFDRYGIEVRRGIYSFTVADRRKIHTWVSKRQAGAIDAALADLIAFGAVCAVLLVWAGYGC